MADEIVIPKILDRASYYLNKASKCQTIRERLEELIADEGRYYRGAVRYIKQTVVPGVDWKPLDAQAAMEDLLAKLMILKYDLEKRISKLDLHIVSLNNLITDMRLTPYLSWPDVHSATITSTIDRLRAYDSMFRRIRNVYRDKLSAVKESVRLLKERPSQG